MITLLVIVFAMLAVAYVIVVALRPVRTGHSIFELKRHGDTATLRREKLIGAVRALKWCVAALLLVLASAVAVVGWQWLGVLLALVLVLLAVPVSRIKPVSRGASKLYKKIEPSLLDLLEKRPFMTWFILDAKHALHDQQLESTEQLLHMVEAAEHVLDDEQRTIIANGIYWHSTPVSEIMTPRKSLRSVKYSELLGPLVLDDLHRSGHSRFPVTRKNIDTIVGILDITDLLELSVNKNTPTAEEVMSPQAPRIDADEPLPRAFAMLQKSRQHMLIVVDGDGGTVGLVTLADITRSLLGKTGVK